MNAKKLAVILGICAMLATIANAQIVFQDDFENVPGVTWPDFSNDSDPIAQTGSYIQVIEQRSGISDSMVDVQVVSNAAPGSPDGSNNYLVIDRVSQAGIRAGFSQRVTEKTTIEFDYFVTADAQHGYGMTVVMQDTAGATWAGWGISSQFKTNGWYLGHPNGSANAFIINLPLNAWAHAKYEIDFDAGTYDISVNDQTYTGIAFDAAVTGLQQIYIGGEYNGSTSYIDNLVVSTVPEPATISILGLGIAGLITRRKK